ncbi:PspC domain-containing protein [Enterococcus sp. AZ196]|uniref:PspC domain-containing protein n=1 Tax=Enterococcus sp. AZ196 TaxID=2774659 RepID=UPI003D269536
MMKKMTKSQNNRVLTGTIAGVAEYFGIDPTIARVAFVFSNFFLDGAPILLYFVLMAIMPKAESRNQSYERPYSRPERQPKRQPKQAETTADDAWSDF